MRSKQFLIISYPYSVNDKVEFRHLQFVVHDIAELFSIVNKVQESGALVSILTSKGDLLTNDGSQDVRFPVGSDGRVLMSDSSEPTGLLWQDPSLLIPAAVWGSITGTLSSQTDLQTALNGKQDTLGYTPLNPANNLSDVSNPSTSRTNLGATTVGSNLFTLANPSAVRWIRINADNTVTARTAAETLSDIGAQASGSYLTASNNLSDVSNAITARTNLGIQLTTTTSDYTNNTTSLTSVTGASFSVVSGEVYYFEISGNMQSGNASGLRLGLSVPSGSTVVYELWGNNTSSITFQSRSESYSGGEIVQTICAVASTRLGFRIFGTITAGNNGTVQLQGRIVGSGYTITLYSGLRVFVIKK